jgi:type I restriction enzyme M protein
MNLAIRGIESDQVKWNGQGSFLNDEQKDLRADFILANPPFNDSDWGGDLLQDDVRWKFGVPPKNNANFAWVQHFIHHLSPTGMAGFVLANGSMASNTSGEGEIRKNIVEADLVDCMVALPPQLFYNTMIPACLWFASRDKKNHKSRNRREHVLFIDARKLGTMVDRRHRELTEVDIRKISDTYHAWRGELKEKNYRDIPGFCKSVPLAEIRKNESILTPGRYVGAAEVPEDTEQFDEKMKLLVAKLHAQIDQGQALDDTIVRNLKELGHGE